MQKIDSIKLAYEMISDESFYLYKTRDLYVFDYFSELSDEIVLQILKWLPKKTLMKCSLVNKRFHRLTQDKTLWARMDLAGKSFRTEAIGRVISRGVIILRLAQTKIVDPIFAPDFFLRSDEFESKLQYLDLSMSSITTLGLQQLLRTCRELRKLSLEHVQLNDAICEEISQNTEIEVLNMCLCSGLTAQGLRNILENLYRLQSLNISWTNLETESVAILVARISSSIVRLNLAGCRKTMTNDHMSTLVDRCPNLRELDASDCNLLTIEIIRIIMRLSNLEYLSLSRCYNFSAYSFIDFQNMPFLSYLDIFGMLSDSQLKVVVDSLPNVGINKFINSAVARPTVGTRRTSIWGLRTRD